MNKGCCGYKVQSGYTEEDRRGMERRVREQGDTYCIGVK